MHSRAHDFLMQPPQLHSAIASKLILSGDCHIQQTNSQSLARRHHQVRNVQFFCPPKNYSGPNPHLGTTLEFGNSTFPLSFGKSFMKIRSAVPENGCLVFCGEREKNRKKTETYVKHIRIRLIGGSVNETVSVFVLRQHYSGAYLGGRRACVYCTLQMKNILIFNVKNCNVKI